MLTSCTALCRSEMPSHRCHASTPSSTATGKTRSHIAPATSAERTCTMRRQLILPLCRPGSASSRAWPRKQRIPGMAMPFGPGLSCFAPSSGGAGSRPLRASIPIAGAPPTSRRFAGRPSRGGIPEPAQPESGFPDSGSYGIFHNSLFSENSRSRGNDEDRRRAPKTFSCSLRDTGAVCRHRGLEANSSLRISLAIEAVRVSSRAEDGRI